MPTDEFTLADRDLCDAIADEFSSAKYQFSAETWSDLGTRIERVIVGEYAAFSKRDVDAVMAMHKATQLTAIPTADYAARSRALSRLGLLVMMAARGRLPQLRART